MSNDDIHAIRTLTDQYSAAANRTDPKAMAAVYTEDGEIDALGNLIKGRQQIEKVFADTMGTMQVMNQICSAGVIEVAGDRATALWSITEFSKRRSVDKLELFIGNYQDELVRTKEGWRFAKRILTRRLQSRFDGVIRLFVE